MVNMMALLRERYPAAETPHSVMRAVFAVAFLAVRGVAWTYMSAFFWFDSVDMLQEGYSSSVPVTYTFLLTNIFMNGLQMIWGHKVVKGLYAAIAGEPKSERLV